MFALPPLVVWFPMDASLVRLDAGQSTRKPAVLIHHGFVTRNIKHQARLLGFFSEVLVLCFFKAYSYCPGTSFFVLPRGVELGMWLAERAFLFQSAISMNRHNV